MIASLTQLQVLNVSGTNTNNQLTEVPEAIASLTQLQDLTLTNNKLKALPAQFANLTQLQNLALHIWETTNLMNFH